MSNAFFEEVHGGIYTIRLPFPSLWRQEHKIK